MIFRFGELFCGPGGLALAAKNSSLHHGDETHKIEHVWATDYDRDTCETYRRNICPHDTKSVIHQDIRKLTLARLERISPIDALAFGFPCNDFSVVGEQKGIDGVYGPLYEYAVKALKRFQPLWFLAENVSGLRNANEGKAFGAILESLFDAGYSIYPHLYKFDKYGIPQARNRIIMVGIRKDINVCFGIPSSDGYPIVTAKDAIEIPPIKNAPNHDKTQQSTTVMERLKHIKPGENAFTANLPKHLTLNVKGAKISQIYKRLDPNKPAYTVTGSGGGGTHVYHWKENRALTNRERARLQAFPDDFVFSGTKESARKQIGMAVPPRGAQIIFEAILKSFADIPYKNEQSNIDPYIQREHLSSYNNQKHAGQNRICDQTAPHYQRYG